MGQTGEFAASSLIIRQVAREKADTPDSVGVGPG